MQLISWLMLGPLHQSDERQTDALGLVCDEPGPFSHLRAHTDTHHSSYSLPLSPSYFPHTWFPVLVSLFCHHSPAQSTLLELLLNTRIAGRKWFAPDNPSKSNTLWVLELRTHKEKNRHVMSKPFFLIWKNLSRNLFQLILIIISDNNLFIFCFTGLSFLCVWLTVGVTMMSKDTIVEEWTLETRTGLFWRRKSSKLWPPHQQRSQMMFLSSWILPLEVKPVLSF